MNQARKAKRLTSQTGSSNHDVCTGLLLLAGIMLCVGSIFLTSRPVGAANQQNYLNYTGVNDTTQKVYEMSLLDQNNQYSVGKMYAEYDSDLTFTITSRIETESTKETTITPNSSTGHSNILGGEAIEVESDNVSILGGSEVKIEQNNDNATVWGGKKLTLKQGKGFTPSVLVGGSDNTIGDNQDGNVILGGANNAANNDVSASTILGGESNTLTSSTGAIIAGSRVNVDGKDYVFAFSDGRDFYPQSSNAFYLNVGQGVGINMAPKGHAGLYSKGLVSVGNVDINTLACNDDNIGLQGEWGGCMVGCSTTSAADPNKRELLNKSEYCKKKCDDNDKCMYNDEKTDPDPNDGVCQRAGGIDGGQTFSDNRKHITEGSKIRAVLCDGRSPGATKAIIYDTLVTESTCPTNNPNQCIYKCNTGYHLKTVTIGGKQIQKCMKDCTLNGKTIQHGQTGLWVSDKYPVCKTNCAEVTKELTCNDGNLNEGIYVWPETECRTQDKICSDDKSRFTQSTINNGSCSKSCQDQLKNGDKQCKLGTQYYDCTCNNGYHLEENGTKWICVEDPCFDETKDGYEITGCASPTGCNHGTVKTPERVVDGKQYSKTFTCDKGNWTGGTEVEVTICNLPGETCADGRTASAKSGTNGSKTFSWTCTKDGKTETCTKDCPSGVWNNGKCESTDVCESTHFNCKSQGSLVSSGNITGGWRWICKNNADEQYNCHECDNGYSWSKTKEKCEIQCGLKMCDGHIPDNATKNTGSHGSGFLQERDTNTNTCTPTSKSWEYNETPGECRFKCNDGKVWSGSACVNAVYNCNGTKPSGYGYILTEKNPTSSSEEKNWTHIADGTAQSSLNACEYTCDTNNGFKRIGNECKCPDGHELKGVSCQPKDGISCGAKPHSENGYKWGDASYTYGHTPTQWTYTSSSTLNPCQYTCDTNYTWSGSKCVENTYTCTGDAPGSNTKKSDKSPTSNKTWTYVSNTNATLGACQWTCKDSSYERDGNTMNCKPKSTPTYICTGNPPSSNVETGSAAPTGGDKAWTERKTGTLGACEFKCINNTIYDSDENECAPQESSSCPQYPMTQDKKYKCSDGSDGTNTGSNTIAYTWTCGTNSCTLPKPGCAKKDNLSGYTVPQLNHGATTGVTVTSGSLTCTANFKCDDGRTSMTGSESCSCSEGTLQGSTLHNGNCAKYEWECVNGVAKCKNETANKYEQDTVCTNAGLTKPTCPTPKKYYITPSITAVTEGTHIEIRLEVKDSGGNSANLPDDPSFVMYFKYRYQYGNSTYSGTTSRNGRDLVGGYAFTVGDNRQNMTNPKLLNAGFDSSFTKQITYGIDTYIMNQPVVKISPECGNAHGGPFSSEPKPSDHLCAVGTASPVSGSGPWTWSCSNDGETMHCSAQKKSSSKYYLEVWFNPENTAGWGHDQELQIFIRDEDGQFLDNFPDDLNMAAGSPGNDGLTYFSIKKNDVSRKIYQVSHSYVIGDVMFQSIGCIEDDNGSPVCTVGNNEYHTYLCNSPYDYYADPSCMSSSAWG